VFTTIDIVEKKTVKNVSPINSSSSRWMPSVTGLAERILPTLRARRFDQGTVGLKLQSNVANP
jgi:hypothetical protein